MGNAAILDFQCNAIARRRNGHPLGNAIGDDLLGLGGMQWVEPRLLYERLRNDPNPPSLKDYRRQMKEPTDAAVMDLVADWIERVDADRSDKALS